MYKNSVYSILADVTGLGIKFIGTALLARFLGVKEVGVFNLVLTLTTMLSLLFMFGTQRSIVYFFNKSKKATAEVIVSHQLLIVLLSILTFIISLAISPLLFHLFKIDMDIFKLTLISAIGTFFHFIFIATQQMMIAFGNFKKYFYFSVVVYSVFVVALFINLNHLSAYYGLISYYLGYFLSIFIFANILIRSTLRIRKKQLISRFIFIHLKNGFQSYWYDIANIFFYRIDYFFVSFFFGPYWLGQYSIAKMLSEGFLQFAKALYNVLFQAIAKNKHITQQLQSLLSYTSVILISLLLIFITFAKTFIIIIFGVEYEYCLPSLKILLISSYFISYGIIFTGLLFGYGHPKYNSKASFIFISAVSLFSVILGFSFNSIEAAASAVCLSSIIYFFYLLKISKKLNLITSPILLYFVPHFRRANK